MNYASTSTIGVPTLSIANESSTYPTQLLGIPAVSGAQEYIADIAG